MGLTLRMPLYWRIRKKPRRLSGLVIYRTIILVTALLLGFANLVGINSNTTNAASNEWYTAGWDKISVGAGDACGISSGTVYCWGFMAGSANRSFYVPTNIDTGGVFNGKQLTDISVSGDHSCAVADGSAYCWGYGSQGQLGDGSQTNSNTPIAVDSSGVLSGKTVTSVVTTAYNTCAVADGSVYCWGQNAQSELGDNTTTLRPTPVAADVTNVLSGKTVTKLSMGGYGGCVIASGEPYCWTQRPGNGQFYSGARTIVPVTTTGVLNGKTITDITAGSSSCAVADGSAYCWGYDSYGELGTGGTGTQNVPVAVDTSGVLNGKIVTTITTGANTGHCVTAEGKAYCWGYNANGQLGDGTNVNRNVPVAVDDSGVLNGKTVSFVMGADLNACALSGRTAYCWGGPGYLGNGSQTSSLTPVEVKPLPPSVGFVSPTSILVDTSGQTMTVYGSNFDSTAASVALGGINASVVSRSDTQIVVNIPMSSTPGLVDVEVTNPDGQSAVLTNGFEYKLPPAPQIDSVNPTSLEIYHSGAILNVYGSHFDTSASILIGGVSAEILSINSTYIAAYIPMSSTPGLVDVEVTNPDGQSAVLTNGFEYVLPPAPTISSVSPTSVATNTSGQSIYIYGSNFNDTVSSVLIGGVSATVTARQNNFIAATIPASSNSGMVDVEVVNPYGQTATLVGGFEYVSLPAPTISSVSPNTVPINTSGREIAIWGGNFDASSVNVLIGGISATVTYRSTNYITATVPSSSTVGSVDVEVMNPDSQSVVLANGIEYTAPVAPSISSTYPNPAQGYMTGGGTMYIYGADFNNPTVTLGGNAATIVYSDTNFIQLTVPSSSVEGRVDLSVVNQDGLSMTLTNGFEYVKIKSLQNGYKGGFGNTGTANGQFDWPEGVMADKDGMVYVTDNGNGRVEVFNADGTYVRQFGTAGTGEGQFDYPTVVKVGPDGNVYVLDSGTLKVSVFTKSGTYLRQFDISAAGYPEGMAFNSKGEMYLTDCDVESTLKVFNTNGTYLRTVGTDGSGDGQFNCSYAITFDGNDNAYVADAANNRIQVFDKNDTFVRKFGSEGIGLGQLGWVEDLVIDQSGNVLVADSDNDRIQVFDKIGTYLGQIGRSGTGNGQFDYPNSITIGNNGNLYITDARNDRVQIIAGMPQSSSPASQPTSTIPVPVVTQHKIAAGASSENEKEPETEPVVTLGDAGEGTPLTDNIVISKRPTFSGVAAPFAEVVVTIHSDPVVCKTTADAEGKWSCTLDRDLPAGSHHVTIELTNQDGTKTTLGPYSVTVKGGDTVNSDSSFVTGKNSSKADKDNGANKTFQSLGIITLAILGLAVIIGTVMLIRRRTSA